MTESKGLPLSSIIAPAYRKLWNDFSSYRVVMGSKGSGKSWAVSAWHIYWMMRNPEANVLVVRQTYTSIKDSVYAELIKAIGRLGVSQFWKPKIDPLELEYLPTHQKIIFKGLDDSMKIASINVPYGELCWAWFEEATDINSWDEFTRVTMSIRPQKLPRIFTLTFNPWSAHHWIKKAFFDTPRSDTYILKTTYKDNPGLTEDVIKDYEMLRVVNPALARVVCDGEWGISEGLIYSNWDEKDFDIRVLMAERPHLQFSYGLDFGYATSYTAFIAAAYDMNTREIFVFDEWYSRGVNNLDIIKVITEMGYGKETIFADSAEPKSINELRQGAYLPLTDEKGNRVLNKEGKPVLQWMCLPNVSPVMKGADSVRNGIQVLHQFRIHVSQFCPRFKEEMANYRYETNRLGETTDKPCKEFDHGPDALRYSAVRFFNKGRGLVVEAKGDDSGPTTSYKTSSRRVYSTYEGEIEEYTVSDAPGLPTKSTRVFSTSE